MLPYRNGFDLCSDIRRARLATQILLLTARSQTADKIAGLKLGADDYVTKPFNTFELMARIEAVLRRATMTEATQSGSAAVYALEFSLLCYFAEHQGMALTRDQMLRDVWGHQAGTLTFTRTADMHAASLRQKQKVERFPHKPGMIVTVPGIGYRFLG